jgi:hypothetical protein
MSVRCHSCKTAPLEIMLKWHLLLARIAWHTVQPGECVKSSVPHVIVIGTMISRWASSNCYVRACFICAQGGGFMQGLACGVRRLCFCTSLGVLEYKEIGACGVACTHPYWQSHANNMHFARACQQKAAGLYRAVSGPYFASGSLPLPLPFHRCGTLAFEAPKSPSLPAARLSRRESHFGSLYGRLGVCGA